MLRLDRKLHCEGPHWVGNVSYTNTNASDMPSGIVTLSVDGVTKVVEHYYGDLSAPAKLTALEAEIDRLLNTAQWTTAQ